MESPVLSLLLSGIYTLGYVESNLLTLTNMPVGGILWSWRATT